MMAAIAPKDAKPLSTEARLQQLMLQWNEVLRKLLELGGSPERSVRRIETALQAVLDEAMAPVAQTDVDRVCDWFGDLVVEAVTLGGNAAAFAVWHVLVAANHHCAGLAALDDPSEAKPNHEDEYYARLVFTAKRWAESSMYSCETIARDCIELMEHSASATESRDFNDYAPHNNEESGEMSLGHAMSYFVIARDGRQFCRATETFAYAASMVALDHNFRPAYRMGLVCWLVWRLRELAGKDA